MFLLLLVTENGPVLPLAAEGQTSAKRHGHGAALIAMHAQMEHWRMCKTMYCAVSTCRDDGRFCPRNPGPLMLEHKGKMAWRRILGSDTWQPTRLAALSRMHWSDVPHSGQ
jgi:hypothetical protein